MRQDRRAGAVAGRQPRADENPADEWRAYRDVDDDLPVFLPGVRRARVRRLVVAPDLELETAGAGRSNPHLLTPPAALAIH